MTVPGTPSPEHLHILLARAQRDGLDTSVVERLTVILHFAQHQYSISETCRQFNISRSTFHRWMERFDPEDLSTLADKSHEPLNLRQSAIDPASIELIRRYRMRYPQMGKERISELLIRDHSTEISASSVGRIIDRECLYFADTPLHWKKRMEHQRGSANSGEMIDSMQPAAEQTAASDQSDRIAAQRITIVPDESEDEPRALPHLTWQHIKRLVIVSSVITNIAFAAILGGMALFERVSETHTASPQIDVQQQEVLHAAPPQVYIP